MDQMIGMRDLDQVLAGMGVGAMDRSQFIGAVQSSLPMRQIVENSAFGRPRQFPFPLTESAALADGGTDTLTGQADREGLLSALFIESNNAAGAAVVGCLVTGVTVNGRNAFIGTGAAPASLCFGAFAQAAAGDDQWVFGVVANGGTVSVGVRNESGAAADISGCFRTMTTDQ